MKTEHVGRTADHYKVQDTPPDRKTETERPSPDEAEAAPDRSQWNEERRRQERGNRGPGEQPGFGQGA